MYSGSTIFVWEININVKVKHAIIIVFRRAYVSDENRGKYTSHVFQERKRVIGKFSGNKGGNLTNTFVPTLHK